MKNRWSEKEADAFVAKYGRKYGRELAIRTYASQLVGAEKTLVLHGGGNTSVKGTCTNILGEKMPAIFVKASGCDLASIEPEGHTALNLDYIKRLRLLKKLSDEAMVNELRTHLFDASSATPSIEALLHAFIPKKYIDHTHADAILALTNRVDAEEVLKKALGDDVIILEYIKPGFDLAKAAGEAFEAWPASKGMVLMKHGLITWDDTARQSYKATIELVTRAEEFLAKNQKRLKAKCSTTPAKATSRYIKLAPLLRGLLAVPNEDVDLPIKKFVIRPLITPEILKIVNSDSGREIALTPPLTSDHLIRTKPFPLWIDDPQYDDEEKLAKQLSKAIDGYAKNYEKYYNKNSRITKNKLERFDPMPRVILLPGLGAICAGRNVAETEIVRDITQSTLNVKAQIIASGKYEGLSEKHLFDMEYFSLQHAKLKRGGAPSLEGSVAMITGAAGAIGSGICRELLENGCHVAVTDLPGENLAKLFDELKTLYGERVMAVPMDVTDPKSVTAGFDEIIANWGGVDLAIINAGIAHVSSLMEMELQKFQQLEKVNVEGTLNILAQVSRLFKLQGAGGDIILISTKNVFSPGARFGAYSATKAASHQLARIASLELAEMGVRVNMVAPDGVFSHGQRKSGLWAEVGPDRMRARGLSEEGLENYYQNRNLLKAKITAKHVANAVMYFATRQTPTTGATIPVDGGLPDATPR